MNSPLLPRRHPFMSEGGDIPDRFLPALRYAFVGLLFIPVLDGWEGRHKFEAIALWEDAIAFVGLFVIVVKWNSIGSWLKRRGVPRLAVSLMAIGAIVFLAGAALYLRDYQSAGRPSQLATANRAADEADAKAGGDPNKVDPEIYEETEADKSAHNYAIRSVDVYNDKIRKDLKEFCDRIEAHFGQTIWSTVDHVTQMVSTNLGDVAPFSSVEAKYPNSVWVAVRVLVAFETRKERPMFMSYIFVGRAAPGIEVIGVYSEDGNWDQLYSGAPANPRNFDLVVRSVSKERTRLLKKLAQEIEKLR